MGRPKLYRTAEDWLMAKAAPDGDCWVARRPNLNRDGYSIAWFDGRTRKVMRFVYEGLAGPIPDGLHLDHLCRNSACFNPDHLEPVTPRENWARGVSPTAMHARKTHCVKGHPYTVENTVFRATGGRRCRACMKTNYK